MSRWVPTLLLCAWLAAAAQEPSKTPPPQVQTPPEEDETLAAPKEYAFNPLQATKEVQVGNYYYKLGKYKAAAGRFREATKWNPNFPDAWLRLGETEEKRHDGKAAKEAYTKYLALA